MRVDSGPKRILILDDDADIRTGIASYLQLLKFEPLQTDQWTEALNLITHQPPDLLLLDLHMPTIQGDAVLSFVRRQGTALPVIVMSAHLNDDIVSEMRLMGVQEFIRKPFHLKDLGALIQKTLGLPDEAAVPLPARPETPPAVRVDLPPAPAAKPPSPSGKGQEERASQEASKSQGRRRRKRRRSRSIPDTRIYITVAWVCFFGALVLLLLSYLWTQFGRGLI